MKTAIIFMLMLALSASPAAFDRENAAEPAAPVDFYSREFSVLLPTNSGTMPTVPDELTGGALNDASYKALLRMEETFNTNVRLYKSDEAPRMLRNSILAADPVFDIALLPAREQMSLGAQGMLYDLAGVDGFRFDQPWWDGSDELAIGGVCYTTRAPLTSTAFENAYVLRVNDAAYADSLYRTVTRGKWTLDKMHRVLLESERTIDDGADGILSGRMLLSGIGASTLTCTEDGLPMLNRSMALFDAADRIAEIFDATREFSQDGALLTVTKFSALDGAPFVLLPKADAKDAGYLTPVDASALTLSMPITQMEPEEAAAFTDAWAQLLWREVLPAYMDAAADLFGEDFSRSCKFMLEWMEPGLTLSLGEAADLTVDLEARVSESLASGSAALASNQARYHQLIAKKIDKLLAGWLYEG